MMSSVWNVIVAYYVCWFIVGNHHYQEEEGEEFVILQFPPLYDPEASRQKELQRVQIDFKAPEEEPDSAQRFIYRRDHTGSIEVLDSKGPGMEEEATEKRVRGH